MTTTAQAGTTTVPAAGPTPGNTTEHGTMRGYRQHKANGEPYCDACRAAKAEQNRKYKKPTAPKPTPQPAARHGRDCITPGCGTPGTDPQPATRMVLIQLHGSRQAPTWYCAGRCAEYGQALADVRAIPVGGGRR